jgi:hypothetical protein
MLFDFLVQGIAVDSQSRGRAGLNTVTLSKNLQNDFAFHAAHGGPVQFI